MWNSFRTERLVICALLTALGVVLGGLLSIPAFPLGVYSVKIGFGVLPVILAGVLFGPFYGGAVGGVADLLQAVLFPRGPYIPWFSLVGILFGLLPGLFYRKMQAPTFLRTLLAVACGQLVGSVLCNTLLLTWLYGNSFWALLPARLVTQAVMIPVHAVLAYTIAPVLIRHTGLPRRQQ